MVTSLIVDLPNDYLIFIGLFGDVDVVGVVTDVGRAAMAMVLVDQMSITVDASRASRCRSDLIR